MNDKQLLQEAAKARKFAYVPYSHFAVGAALVTEDGKIYTGCNIESASYTPTNCAERTAFFKAVSEGERHFRAIAIVGGEEGSPAKKLCPPCGVCRQVMMEFCNPNTFQIILADDIDHPRSFLLKEILPLGFGPKNLQPERGGMAR